MHIQKGKIFQRYNEEGRIKNNIVLYSFIDASIISSLNIICNIKLHQQQRECKRMNYIINIVIDYAEIPKNPRFISFVNFFILINLQFFVSVFLYWINDDDDDVTISSNAKP